MLPVMTNPPRKMSEMLKDMSETILRDPDSASSEAAHVALLFANAAWNECVGLDHAWNSYRSVWETIETDKPDLWNERKSNLTRCSFDCLVKRNAIAW